MIRIDPRSPTPIYRQVVDQVRRMIVTGELEPGAQVESVANLAARAKVNPMTISKAYSSLVEQGALERRRGVGLFVAPVPADVAAAARRQLLDESLRDVAELVVQLDVGAPEAADRLLDHINRLRARGGNHE
jgi:GntR family transcriptional regulator